MNLSANSCGELASIRFFGVETEWERGNSICTRLCNAIRELHASGHNHILVDMGKIERIDNESVRKIITFTQENPEINLSFYNLQRFVKHSFMNNGVQANFLLNGREIAALKDSVKK